MVSSERSSSDLTEYIFYFKLEKYYFIYKNNFIDEKWIFFAFFFKLLSKFRNFINSDDCIGKIQSKSIRLYPVFIQ